MVHVCGGKVVKSGEIVHGKRSAMEHDGKGIFKGIAPKALMTRYHSLVAERSSLPDVQTKKRKKKNKKKKKYY